MAKRRPGEQRAQLCFMRPEDLRLYNFLSKRAYEARYDLGTFILVSLHEAFKGQIDDAEVDALAEEAARKVRERTAPPAEVPAPVEPPPVKPEKLSMEQAAKAAAEQIAQLDAIASTVMKKKTGARKGVPSPPPLLK